MTQPLASPARPPLLRPGRAASPGVPTRLIGGVCAGLAVHVGRPVAWVRVFFVFFAAARGLGIVTYFALWGLVPLGDVAATEARARRVASGRTARSLAEREVLPETDTRQTRWRTWWIGVLILATGFIVLFVGRTLSFDFRPVVLGLGAAGGLALVWSTAQRPATLRQPVGITKVAVGLVGAVMLTLGAVIVSPIGDQVAGASLRLGFTTLVLVLGVSVVALVPVGSALLADHESSTVTKAEADARAEVAAHLHDSVLQTLALIRTRAHDPDAVVALARTQERELRTWLYDAKADPGDSLAALLAQTVAGIEDQFGVTIEIVTVGDTRPDPWTAPLADIIAEATQNAVRHGRPPVSVYVEISADKVEAHVLDRGDGFALDQIDPHRFGVRDSILGRAARLGGSAQITSGAAGCDVEVILPLTKEAQR